VFTPEAAATAAAGITFAALFDPLRAARMNAFHSEDASNPAFSEAVTATIQKVWKEPVETKLGGISRAIRSQLVARLMALAADASVDPQVRAVATESLRGLRTYIATKPATALDLAHQRATRDDIDRFLDRPDAPRKQSEPLPIPAGPPI
jgi:hypothetical protein